MSRITHSNSRFIVPQPVPIVVQEQYIYCPVCHVEYPQSQTDNHIRRHTIQNPKATYKREEEVAVSTQHSKNTFIYPMVQPLQFSTNQISQVNKRDVFKIDRKQKNKKQPRTIIMVDQQTQTVSKPPLQYRSNETDFYNCFDSIFNTGKLQSEDLIGRNSIIASKRPLNQWQHDRVRK